MMAELQSLRTHLITELRDLLDAEQQLTRVLPDFASRATSAALRTAFEEHVRETGRHIDRLKQSFEMLGETPEGALRDAVMITAAQKVEHYEMASYGTAGTYATVLGEPRVARLLEETLREEKNADLKLTQIAEDKINEKAAEEWHHVSAGLLEQTAALAGKAIAIGARTVTRAADVVGRRPAPPRQASREGATGRKTSPKRQGQKARPRKRRSGGR